MINKEQRKKHIEYSKQIKKVLDEKTNLKLRRRVLKMVGDNPFIELSVNDWENEEIPNNLRVLVCKALDITPLNLENVDYGNIKTGGITLYLREWVLVMEALKNEK